MKRIIQLGILFFVATLSLLQLGCKKPDFSKIAGVKWDANLAAPIGYADFDVYDVLTASDSNNLVIINQTTGEIALSYDSEIASFDAASVIPLQDISENYSLALPDLGLSVIPAFSQTITSNNKEKISLSLPNGIQLHDLRFLNGNLTLGVSTTLRHNIDLNVRFIDLKSNNVVVARNIVMNYGGSLPQTAFRNIDLQDLVADFTAGGTSINELRVEIDATIKGTGQPIANNEKIDIEIGLTNQAFKNATGYFGQQLLADQSDTIEIKIFNKNTTTGVFALTNPQLNFRVENSFGIPIDINFSNMKTINTIDGQEYPLVISNPKLSLNLPSNPGETAITNLGLNSSNTSNLSTIITPTPKLFNYGITATSNPNGPTAKLNFIDHTSKFTLRGELLLPMEGYAYDFTVSDTIPFSLDNNVEAIESAMFRLNIHNGFPVSFRSEVVFLDENYQPLFTLVDGTKELISAGKINSAGKVIESVTKITDVVLTEAQILLLDDVKHILLSGTAETTQPKETVVKFYDSYKMALKLAMQVKLNANFKVNL